MKKIFLMRPKIGNQEIDAVTKVIQSRHLTEGKITNKFEKNIARYVHSKYAIATTSGTAALHTAFEGIKIQKKHVLVSDYTFPATVQAIIQARGIPVLIDVDKNSMNTTSEIIENSLDRKIEVIVPVSLFGNPLEKEIYKFQKKGLKIVEDAATNLGAKIENNFIGSLADVTCFSFHPRKIITTGEGGMITTNNKKLAEKFRAFKFFGKTNERFQDHGINYKLSDIQSSIGISQLKKIEKIIEKRRIKAKIYDELLSKINFIEPQQYILKSRHTYQSYTCIITKKNFRNRIRKKLIEKNIETQIGSYAIHMIPLFSKCLRKGKLTNSKFLYLNSLTLPLHEELTDEEQEFICKNIKEILKN